MTNKISWSETRSEWEAHLQNGILIVREPGSARWMRVSEHDTKIFLGAYALDD